MKASKRELMDLGERIDFIESVLKRELYCPDFLHKQRKYSLLPKGVKFVIVGETIGLMFGNDQTISYFENSYSVWHMTEPRDVTDKCHLKPCKSEDLKAGDWYISCRTNNVSLFINEKHSFTPTEQGAIFPLLSCGLANESKIKEFVELVVYVP